MGVRQGGTQIRDSAAQEGSLPPGGILKLFNSKVADEGAVLFQVPASFDPAPPGLSREQEDRCCW